MDVKETLTAALQAVTEAEIPEDLREVAFGKAVDLLAGCTIDSRSRPQQNGTGQVGAPTSTAAAGGALEKIAARLSLEVEAVDRVFEESGETIDVVIAPSKLAKPKKEATQQIALLIAAGRQGAGLEERTTLDVIRTKCEEFKRLDPPNFSKAMNALNDEFTFSGSGKTRAVKMSRPGWTKAGELVTQLTKEADT